MNIDKTKPIGEIFEYCGIKLQVVENEDCNKCFFLGNKFCFNNHRRNGHCRSLLRKDNKSVIFKRIDNK